MSRTARLVVASAVCALALAGCAGPTEAGAAAVVGDTRITVTQLSDLVARSSADPQAQQQAAADKPAFQRQVLRRLINHVVLEAAAKDEKVSVDGGAVDETYDNLVAQVGGEDQLKQQAAAAGIAAADLRAAVADIALRDALSDKLTASIVVPEATLRDAYQKNIDAYDQVHTAHIVVPTEAKARQLLAQVQRDPGLFATLAKANTLDAQHKDNGGDLGFQGRGALEKGFADAAFAAKPGTFVLARTSLGFHVISVIEHRTTSLAQATPQLRRGLLNEQRGLAVTALLTKTSKKLGVKVNPRFGEWDVKTQDVDAPKDVAPVTPSATSDASTAPSQ